MSENDDFDENVLREWGKLDPDAWKEIVLNLLELFFKTQIKCEAELATAKSERDIQRLVAVVHKMKSNFGNVGARKAHGLLSKAETELRSDRLNEGLMTLASADPVLTTAIAKIESFQIFLRQS